MNINTHFAYFIIKAHLVFAIKKDPHKVGRFSNNSELFNDVGNCTSTNGPATFTNRELGSLFDCDWVN